MVIGSLPVRKPAAQAVIELAAGMTDEKSFSEFLRANSERNK